MAKAITSSGIPAYSNPSGLSGAEMWKNWSKSVNTRAHSIIDEILEYKGVEKYKSQ